MREFKASTRQGQNIIKRASYHEGYSLADVYGSYSDEKAQSYNHCFELYARDYNAGDFHICSHNSFCYSVAWNTIINGEKVLRVETANNSFLVWLER